MDAAPRGQRPQRSEQAPPPLQYVKDRIRLADGQRRCDDEPARCAGGRIQAGRHRRSGDCLRALGDGQSLGDFSLTIVLYGRSRAELDQLVAEFSGVFTNADGNLFVETYNQLNAYFATVPGNYALNLR